MALVLVGINHQTADIALREKVAFPPELIAKATAQLVELPDVNEAVIVSTCNRTELYLDMDSDIRTVQTQQQQQIIAWLAKFHQLEVTQLQSCNYFHFQDEVLKHLMQVSCGLDSMVLGEPQILGQIKSAYAHSSELGTVGENLGRAFRGAFSIAKQVRTDTAIGENPVSVAYAAAALAERIFSDFGSLHALLIGAGKTIELVAQHLKQKGLHNIVVANRSLENALKLSAKIDAHAVLLSDIPEQLNRADIVVSSTNSQLPLLGKGAVERALKQRKHKPMLLVDLAVPRDIEPQVAEIADAYLYSIDDISSVIEDNVKSRSEAAAQAEIIIERGVQDYKRQLRSLNAVSILREFRSKAESLRAAELEKALKAFSNGEPAEKVLESLARAITNKLIHSPTVQMKKASADGRDEVLALVQELFELSGGESSDENP